MDYAEELSRKAKRARLLVLGGAIAIVLAILAMVLHGPAVDLLDSREAAGYCEGMVAWPGGSRVARSALPAVPASYAGPAVQWYGIEGQNAVPLMPTDPAGNALSDGAARGFESVSNRVASPSDPHGPALLLRGIDHRSPLTAGKMDELAAWCRSERELPSRDFDWREDFLASLEQATHIRYAVRFARVEVEPPEVTADRARQSHDDAIARQRGQTPHSQAVTVFAGRVRGEAFVWDLEAGRFVGGARFDATPSSEHLTYTYRREASAEEQAAEQLSSGAWRSATLQLRPILSRAQR
ncbi:MAG: hypothetical protein K8H88_08035 [Sandaracinaceae bacterium]|nr:hypothetical protein [Sandaracinaceae bacterium]